MPSAKDVVFHQLRQVFTYTFYFSGCQLMAFHYSLKANWTLLLLIILLIISFYEDTAFCDQHSVPESVMILRIWANNFPLLIAQTLTFLLERGNFIVIKEQEDTGPRLVGRPNQMVVKLGGTTGLEILDDVLIGAGYFLLYFNTVAMFRALMAQYRFVHHLMTENLSWSSDENDNHVHETHVHHHFTNRNFNNADRTSQLGNDNNREGMHMNVHKHNL